MEGSSMENWMSELEMDEEDIFNQSQSNINSFDEQEDFLREILQEVEFSPERGYPIAEGGAISPTISSLSFEGNGTLHKRNSINSTKSLGKYPTSPTTQLLSFDNPSVEPLIHEPPPNHDSTFGSKKRTTKGDDFEEPREQQAAKKGRRSKDHIVAERKRRQELTRSIIALSATIPGLKKMDKAYVLSEALKYIKQLKEHVKELENQNKERRVASTILTRKFQASTNKHSTYCETNTNMGGRCIESPLEIEARVLEKEVLIGIHCDEEQKHIVYKVHVLLEKLHLSISSSSLLQFGASTLIITIIAQMDDEYSMTMDDLVKSLRQNLSDTHDM